MFLLYLDSASTTSLAAAVTSAGQSKDKLAPMTGGKGRMRPISLMSSLEGCRHVRVMIKSYSQALTTHVHHHT